MIDALLAAVQDVLQAANIGYDVKHCNIHEDGHPAPDIAGYYLSIHQGAIKSTTENYLSEQYGFSLTLSMTVSDVPPDRIGDRRLASRLARQAGPNGSPSFNARVDVLRAMMHMNWETLNIANTYLVQWAPPNTTQVYGFCEPARYRGCEIPQIAGGDWFFSESDEPTAGLKAEMRFEDALRFQAIATYV